METGVLSTKNVIDQVRAGTWKSESLWYGIEKGIVGLSPMSSLVPDKVKERVLATQAGITKGTVIVFKGPVKDQKGAARIAAGAVPSDGDLLGMNWFVQGVVGTTE